MKFIMAILLTVTFTGSAFAGDATVPYPTNYRDWHHVKSMVINEGHSLYGSFGGIHHLYANKKAMKGYQSGKFPDGAVIVFDLLEAKHGGNAVVEGDRKVAGVMHKNASKFASTGGWGFEGFANGDKRKRVVGKNAKTACFGCHEPNKDRDYVFSSLRD